MKDEEESQDEIQRKNDVESETIQPASDEEGATEAKIEEEDAEEEQGNGNG